MKTLRVSDLQPLQVAVIVKGKWKGHFVTRPHVDFAPSCFALDLTGIGIWYEKPSGLDNPRIRILKSGDFFSDSDGVKYKIQ